MIPLVEALDDKDRLVRHEAARSLGVLAAPQSVPHLLRVAQESDDRFLRDVVGKALCQINDPAALKFMENSWKHGSTRVRAAALEGLVRFQPNEAQLEEALTDDDAWVRQQALRIWVKSHPTQAPTHLIKLIATNDRGLAPAAARALENVDMSAHVSVLLELLGKPLPRDSRDMILRKLAEAGNPGRIPDHRDNGSDWK